MNGAIRNNKTHYIQPSIPPHSLILLSNYLLITIDGNMNVLLMSPAVPLSLCYDLRHWFGLGGIQELSTDILTVTTDFQAANYASPCSSEDLLAFYSTHLASTFRVSKTK